MAKNKGLKWIVGLSSVAVFTGFVGLSQKYDQSQSNVATTNATQNNDENGSYFPDDHSQTWDNSGSWSDSDNGDGFQGGFSGNENSDNNQIRGHAS